MIRFSNSKLNLVLNCPMSYYLNYVKEISLKDKPTALALGSAVHYGLEIGDSNLDEYFKKNGNFEQRNCYSNEQLLAESMVNGYLKHKEEIFNDILTYNGEKLNVVDEQHELELTASLPDTDDTFFGIIDLLLLTEKGFILLDYKTSSITPNWDEYIEQIYRYIFLLRENFPGVPILKIGIINLRKTQVRQKKNENEEELRNRIRWEYESNSDNYINYHEYLPSELEPTLINNYIDNLYKMCKTASSIITNENWYISYTNANGMYKSQYWDIFYSTPNAYIKYKIKDKIWDEENDVMLEERDCNELDMQCVVLGDKLLNKYVDFENLIIGLKDKESYLSLIGQLGYEFDEELIEKYYKTYQKLHNL